MPALLVFAGGLALGVDLISAVGLGFTAYSLHWYLSSLGRDIAILQAAALIAAIQWVLSPWVVYTFVPIEGRYGMYIDRETYMHFAVPATLFFGLGIRIFHNQLDLRAAHRLMTTHERKFTVSAYYLLALGFLGNIAQPFVPSTLAFPFFLLSQLQFIAVVYLLLCNHKLRWQITLAIFVIAAITSINTTLFGTIFIWATLVFSVIQRELRLSLIARYSAVIAMFFVLTTVQTLKSELRENVWYGDYTGSRIALVADLIANGQKESFDVSEYAAYESIVIRLNQGWIISAVMSNVPSRTPHVGGSTIWLAARDSIIPRALIDKRELVASDNFRRFTGLRLSGSTSMGISVLGEAWANFGHWGTIFMFAWGAALGLATRAIAYLTRVFPTIIAWTPLIFLQAVKAETEFAQVLNHITKSILVVIFLLWIMRAFLKARV